MVVLMIYIYTSIGVQFNNRASPIETRCGHELLGDPSRKASRRYSVHSPSFGDPRNSAGRNGPVRSFNRRGLSFIEGWIPKSVSSDGWWPPMIWWIYNAVWKRCWRTNPFGRILIEKSTKNWTAFLVIFGATTVLGQPGLTWRCVGLSLWAVPCPNGPTAMRQLPKVLLKTGDTTDGSERSSESYDWSRQDSKIRVWTCLKP